MQEEVSKGGSLPHVMHEGFDTSVLVNPSYSPPPYEHTMIIIELIYLSTTRLKLRNMELTSNLCLSAKSHIYFVKWSTNMT